MSSSDEAEEPDGPPPQQIVKIQVTNLSCEVSIDFGTIGSPRLVRKVVLGRATFQGGAPNQSK